MLCFCKLYHQALGQQFGKQSKQLEKCARCAEHTSALCRTVNLSDNLAVDAAGQHIKGFGIAADSGCVQKLRIHRTGAGGCDADTQRPQFFAQAAGKGRNISLSYKNS